MKGLLLHPILLGPKGKGLLLHPILLGPKGTDYTPNRHYSQPHTVFVQGQD